MLLGPAAGHADKVARAWLAADGKRWRPIPTDDILAVYRIGDCVAPRIVAEAIFDGHRLAREIDAENPAVPLPYRRERISLESASTH